MRKKAEELRKKYSLGIVDMQQSLAEYDRVLSQIAKGKTIKALVETVLQKKKCARLLDLGCGSGQAMAELKKLFGEKVFCIGIDLVEPESNGFDLFLLGDAVEMGLPANIDLLFSFRALHEAGETEKVFQKICACLAEGGRAFLSVRLWFAVGEEHKWHANMDEKGFSFLEKISREKKFRDCKVSGTFVEVPVGNAVEAGFNVLIEKKKNSPAAKCA